MSMYEYPFIFFLSFLFFVPQNVCSQLWEAKTSVFKPFEFINIYPLIGKRDKTVLASSGHTCGLHSFQVPDLGKYQRRFCGPWNIWLLPLDAIECPDLKKVICNLTYIHGMQAPRELPLPDPPWVWAACWYCVPTLGVSYARGKELVHVPQGAFWANELIFVIFTIKNNLS